MQTAIAGSSIGHIQKRKWLPRSLSTSIMDFSRSVTTPANAVRKRSLDPFDACFQIASPIVARSSPPDFQTTWPCQSQSRTYVSAKVISDVTLAAADGEFCDGSLTACLFKWELID
jgi:hypothetical protein